MELIRKSCILCLSVLLCLLLPVSGVQGAVLCHGEDGHLAIEAADSICCSKISDCSSQERSTDSAERGLSSEHDCGACTDIPISIGFAAVAKESSRGNPALPASGIVAFAAVDSADSSEHWPVSDPFVSSLYFTPLRSIVLLI
jgi:hypothetical protein